MRVSPELNVEGRMTHDRARLFSAQSRICRPADQRRLLPDRRLLDAKERAVAQRVRDFMEAEVAPIIEDYWARDKFPLEIIPKIAALGIGGVGYQGYGAAGGSMLLERLHRHGAGARRLVDRHLLGRAYRPLRRLDLSLRRRGAEAALAAGDDALREDRLVRPDRAAGRLGDVGRDDDDLPARRRRLGPQRREEMDRQRDLRRHQRHLGARRGLGPGQGLRGRQGQSRLFGQEDRDQDGAARGPERADHAEGLPRAGGRPAAERQHLQGHRQGAENDARRRRMVRGRLRAGRLRACAAICDRAHAIRQADRRLPARSGFAGAHARQRDRDGSA